MRSDALEILIPFVMNNLVLTANKNDNGWFNSLIQIKNLLVCYQNLLYYYVFGSYLFKILNFKFCNVITFVIKVNGMDTVVGW